MVLEIPNWTAPSAVIPEENPDKELCVTSAVTKVVGSKLVPSLLVMTKLSGKTTLSVPPLVGMLTVIAVVVVRKETEVMLSDEGLLK